MQLPSPLTPFDVLCTPTFVAEGTARAVYPDTWQVGRGLFGGLVTATLVRALELATPDRPLRSLTAELFGPVQPGEVTLELSRLREGSAVTTTTIRLVQGGEVQAHGVGVLGKTRTTERDRVALKPPTPTPWREVEVMPVEPPMGPVFSQHFEYRPTGAFPFSGATVAEAEGWLRPKVPVTRRDAAFLAGCIDVYWPTIYLLEPVPRPMATIAFTFQPFARFEGLDPEAPLFHRAKLIAAEDGYCVEYRELWGEDGRLLALNQQTFAIIK